VTTNVNIFPQPGLDILKTKVVPEHLRSSVRCGSEDILSFIFKKGINRNRAGPPSSLSLLKTYQIGKKL
jgi:hypothetical protein